MTDMEIYTQNKPYAQYKGFIQEPQTKCAVAHKKNHKRKREERAFQDYFGQA